MRRLLPILLFLLVGSLGSDYDAILVRSDILADWILAQSYSQRSGIPIVATAPDSLGESLRSQLAGYRGFGFSSVLIIGGEKAISPTVQQELEEMGYATHRIVEADRYGTSAQVAMELFPDSKIAIVVDGAAQEALLVAGRIASATGNPVLFIKGDQIPPSVARALDAVNPERIIFVDLGSSGGAANELSAKGFVVERITKVEEFKLEGARVLRREYLYLAFGVLVGVALLALALRLKGVKEQLPYTLLTGDEEKLVKAIMDSGGEVTQDKLPEITSFSRPKVSRLVAELEARGILSKEPLGRTQKLVVRKEFYEKSV